MVVSVQPEILAADDAAQRFGPFVIGDDHHRRIERVLLAVQRGQALALARHADDDAALDLVGVKGVQRARHVEGDVVGDVHQRRNRAQADGQQLVLHPLRRRAVRHTPDGPPDIQRAGVQRLDGHADGAGEGSGHRGGVQAALDQRLQAAQTGRRQIAGDAAHPGAIGAVGGEVDVDHRIAQARVIGVARADRRVVRQFDDAVMLVGQLQLALGAHHAVGFDAPDDALLQRDVGTGDVGPLRRENALQPGARVGRAADDLKLFRSGVHHQHAQLVGVGVFFRRHDMGDAERRQLFRAVLNAFDLKAKGGQLFRDLVERSLGFQMVLQPGQRELHSIAPYFSGVMPILDPTARNKHHDTTEP